jgi:Flp pilus assembly protein CpaB
MGCSWICSPRSSSDHDGRHTGERIVVEEDREQIQRWLDALYRRAAMATQLDAVVMAQTFDLPADAMDVITGLPPGRYTRQALCDQLNSAIVGRGLSRQLGTHD